MLDYLILSKKDNVSIIKDNKKVVYKDLLSSSWPSNLDKSNDVNGRYIIVNNYYVARPDLISLAVYGDDKYADIICKVNGISNPFELNENMLIFIPSMDSITNLLNEITSGNSDILSDFKSSKNSIYTKDNIKYKKLETIEKKNSNHQKFKNEKRSPSEQTINDKNYFIDKKNGFVIY